MCVDQKLRQEIISPIGNNNYDILMCNHKKDNIKSTCILYNDT